MRMNFAVGACACSGECGDGEGEEDGEEEEVGESSVSSASPRVVFISPKIILAPWSVVESVRFFLP